MRFLFAFLALMLLAPSATATFSIDVPNQEPQSYQKTGRQGPESYVFQLQNPPFNLTNTNGDYANASLYTAKMQSKFIEPGPISSTKSYEITVEFNDTHNYRTFFTYEKHGFSIFSYWNAYYSLQRDGSEICNQQVMGIIGQEIRPNPSFLFDFSQRGSYNSVELIGTDRVNVSGEVLYNNPSLNLYWTDDVIKRGTGRLGNTFGLDCGDASTLGGAIFDDVFEITSAPIIHLTPSDQRTYTHEIRYHFQNRTVSVSEAASEIGQINLARQSCNLFFAGICMTALVGDLIKAVFDLALTPFDLLLSFLSGGTVQLKNTMSVAMNTLFGVYDILFTIVFLSGNNFPMGGILVALLVWFSALGFLIWSITGNPYHVIGLPYWIVKGLFFTIVILTYGLWIWLPIKSVELVTRFIQNLRG